MAKNTFIALPDGSRRGWLEGRCSLQGLPVGVVARYCECDYDTTHIDEIPDWDTSQDCLITNEMKLAYIVARNECDDATKDALRALEKILKVVIQGMSD